MHFNTQAFLFLSLSLSQTHTHTQRSVPHDAPKYFAVIPHINMGLYLSLSLSLHSTVGPQHTLSRSTTYYYAPKYFAR